MTKPEAESKEEESDKGPTSRPARESGRAPRQIPRPAPGPQKQIGVTGSAPPSEKIQSGSLQPGSLQPGSLQPGSLEPRSSAAFRPVDNTGVAWRLRVVSEARSEEDKKGLTFNTDHLFHSLARVLKIKREGEPLNQ